MKTQILGREVNICDVKIPANGSKLHMIAGRVIFARPIKGLVYFYDVATKLQLCVVQAERFDYGIELIKRRIDEIPNVLGIQWVRNY